MRFFAVNGSPRAGKGVTDLILRPFVEGLAEVGAEPASGVPVRYLRTMNVAPCRGDWACWIRTPGRCSQADDMNDLYPLIRGSDILILATPLYFDGMTGPMKTFVDRLIPLLDPMVEVRDGRCRHPLQAGQELDRTQIVLVSVAGFWELENFAPLVEHVKAIGRNLGRSYGGALLRPHGPAFGLALRAALAGQGSDGDGGALDVVEAARQCGRELGSTGSLVAETLERVARPLVDRDTYIRRTNESWRVAIDRQGGPGRGGRGRSGAQA